MRVQVVRLPLSGLLGRLKECSDAGLHVEAMLYTLALGWELAGAYR